MTEKPHSDLSRKTGLPVARDRNTTPEWKKEQIPALSLLQALGIPSAEHLPSSSSRRSFSRKYPDYLSPENNAPVLSGELVRVSIPESSIPHEGEGRRDVLATFLNELVNREVLQRATNGGLFVSHADFLYDDKGRLLALFPVIDGAFTIEQRRGLAHASDCLCYADFSSYYFDFSNIQPDTAESQLEQIRKEIEPMTVMIRECLWNEYPEFYETFVRRKNDQPLALLDIDIESRNINTRTLFDPTEWAFDKSTFRPRLIQKEMTLKPGHKIHVIPVYPSVYFPAENNSDDRQFYSGIFHHAQLQPNERVWVCGCGSGIDTVIAAHFTQTDVFASDINPISVVNTLQTTRSAGYSVTAKQADGLLEPDGAPAFPGKFDVVLWNAPSFALSGSREKSGQKELRSFSDVHDNLEPEILERFVQALPKVLNQHTGRAYIWGVPQFGVDTRTGEQEDLLEKILTFGTDGTDDVTQKTRPLFTVQTFENTSPYSWAGSKTYLLTFPHT